MIKFLYRGKDGGPDSKVSGFWLFESKRFGSIVLLIFEKGSREAYHTHAFDAVSWILKGELKEVVKGTKEVVIMKPSWKPILTPRNRFHRVFGVANKTYALSFRGPWLPRWKEFLPKENKEITLTNGRKIIGE